MSVRLVSSPWAAFAGEPGLDLPSDELDSLVAGVMPRLIGPGSPSSLWNRSRPVLASWGGKGGDSQWDFPLPTSSGDQSCHELRAAHRVQRIELPGLPDRAHESVREADDRESWLQWQLQCYAELASFDITSTEVVGLEARLPFGARRSWTTVSRIWQMGGDGSAELSLIVQLARRMRLLNALRAVERAPRRVLERRHVQQRIARIQEMDSTTLRAYSRAPGRTAAEKAGSRQELLAVVRRDTVDLAENRVLLWCARRMDRMAAAYLQRNRAFVGSERFALVRQLGRLSRKLPKSPLLEEVGELPHHLSTPTYCLQFEARYRQVWTVYRELRRQERLIDDAWRWQVHLWGTTARLLVSALLGELEGWEEIGVSTPYFRSEGGCGKWTCGPSTPGPFVSPWGVCEVLEFRQPRIEQDLRRLSIPSVALSSGADWALAWPDSSRITLVWGAVAAANDSPGLDTRRLSARLRELSASDDWSWSGLILLAEPAVAAAYSEWVAMDPAVSVLRFPENIHRYWKDLGASLERALTGAWND